MIGRRKREVIVQVIGDDAGCRLVGPDGILSCPLCSCEFLTLDAAVEHSMLVHFSSTGICPCGFNAHRPHRGWSEVKFNVAEHLGSFERPAIHLMESVIVSEAT